MPSAMVHTLKGGFSLDPNKSTSYLVSQWIFAMKHQSLSFISFGWAWVLGESWRTGGKSSGKNMPRNPFHSPPENLLNIWPVLCKPMDCPGQNIGVVVFPFSSGSSQPRDRTQVSHIASRSFTSWATREAQEYRSGSLSLLQRIFLTQELKQGLLHCRQILNLSCIKPLG